MENLTPKAIDIGPAILNRLFVENSHDGSYLAIELNKDLEEDHNLASFFEHNLKQASISEPEYFNQTFKFNIDCLQGCLVVGHRRLSRDIVVFIFSVDNVPNIDELNAKPDLSFEANHLGHILSFTNCIPTKPTTYTMLDLARAALNRWGARSQLLKLAEEGFELSSIAVKWVGSLESSYSDQELHEKVAAELCDIEAVLLQLAIVWQKPIMPVSLVEPETYEKANVSKFELLNAIADIGSICSHVLMHPSWTTRGNTEVFHLGYGQYERLMQSIHTIKSLIDPSIVFEQRKIKADKFYEYVKEELCIVS